MPYSGNKMHPTQKPVAALAQLIRSFTLPNELVLDCFAGSGSTCAAAMLTSRTYIGIEMDRVYYEVACQRLQRVQERITAKRSLSFIPVSVAMATRTYLDEARSHSHWVMSMGSTELSNCHSHFDTESRQHSLRTCPQTKFFSAAYA